MPVPKPVAIVGVSALFPGSLDNLGFWRDILVGRDLLGKVPPSHWLIEDYFDADIMAPDKTYADRGAFLDKVDFAPMNYGVPPNILAATDSAQLLAMFVAKQLLDDTFSGSGGFEEADLSRTGVILGVASTTELCAHMAGRLQQPVWEEGMRRSGLEQNEIDTISKTIADMYVPWQESSFPGLLGNVVSGRVANRFDLGGTNCVIDAACASSLAALEMGVNQLSLGQADMMITGGVDTLNDILMYMCFSKTGALSKTGDCRPFSDNADGTMMAEGVGMFAMKRLEDAERDGNDIFAVIQGVGSSSDGRAKSIYAPRPEGQSLAIRRAYDDAGYSPKTVELIEAHGTATPAGDAAEFAGLQTIFEPNDDPDDRWCALGSVKSQIGHAKAAAGAAGLFKTVMSLTHRILPPTIKVDQPSSKLGVDESAFYINTEARPWIRGSDHPRRNGVSAFGFGGTNFHVTLEEYTGPGNHAPRQRTLGQELIVLSADKPSDLTATCRELAEDLDTEGMATYLAQTTQQDFDASKPARLAILTSGEADLKKKLDQAAKTINGQPKTAFSTPGGVHYGFDVDPGEVAFLFPGQGSQYVGMGKEWAMHFDTSREVWDRTADMVFDPKKKLHNIVFPPPTFTDEEVAKNRARLTATEWAQPALGATSLSALALLTEMGFTPSSAAGHSYGEITALAAAGVLDEESMLKVSRKRGELMAAASDIPGAMCAVQASVEEIQAHLKDWGVDVVVANHNSPLQCVLSGAEEAVDEVEKLLKKESIPFTRLSVSTAFHSSLVSDSSKPFLKFLKEVDFKKANFPVYANTSAAEYPKKPAEMRKLLANQLAKPVRFVEQIQAMYESGARTFVEVGPHSTLTGLVGKILGDAPYHSINLDRRGKSGLESLFNAIGYLVSRGVKLDFAPLWKNYAPVVDPRTKGASGFTVEIGGANYGKPYPNDHEDLRPEPNERPRPQKLIDEIRREMPAPTPPAPRESTAMTNQNNNDQNQNFSNNSLTASTQTNDQTAPAQNNNAGASTWVDAFREQQRETARAHRTYQETTADAHRAFLETMNTSFQALGHIAGGDATQTGSSVQPSFAAAPSSSRQTNGSVNQPYTAPASMLSSTPMPQVPNGAVANGSYANGAPANGAIANGHTPVPQPAAPAPVAQAAAPAPRAAAPAPAPAAPAPAPAPAAPAAPDVDLLDMLLKVVAEKTGYPTEMLEPTMELEADLGVDSIKQVEIMAQMEEEIPELPEVDASDLAELRTLQAIGDHLLGLLGRAPGAATSAPAAAAAPAAPAPAAQDDLDVEGVLLEVVADKTGYPSEMLEPSMELEADLGVDSIKQVEIMAQMEERLPGLPEVEASVLADLRTIHDIAMHLEGLLTGRAPRTQSTKDEEAADDDSESDISAAGIARYRVAPVSSKACGWAMPGLFDLETLYVVSDGQKHRKKVGPALVKELTKRGVKSELVAELPAGADAAIFVDALRTIKNLEEATDVNRRAIMCAHDLTKADQGPKFFVTVQNTGGRFQTSEGSIESAWTAGVGALAKSAAAEWPTASVKCIDINVDDLSAKKQAAAIADELFFGGPEIEVGIDAKGTRITPVATAEVVERGEAFEGLKKDSILVVSGGAKGVTATSIIELAKELPLRFVLLGRTELTDEPAAFTGITDDGKIKKVLLAEAKKAGTPLTPKKLQRQARHIASCREIRATIDALESAGSKARYASADVTDSPRITEICKEVRDDWGQIDGIIHGAGVLADALIEKKTVDQFDFVFNTKIQGLQALLDATKSDDLKIICLFSSVAARSGNPGQSDYAMANEVLNKIAHAESKRRGPSCRVKSLGWGPWDGGMVTPSLKVHFEAAGIVLLPEAQGARMLVDELLYAPHEDIELVLGGAVTAEGINGSHLSRGVCADIVLSPENQPYLDSHRLRGIPVVPAMLVVEWFTRFAQAACPHLYVKRCRDLVVQKGAQVEGFEEGTHHLTIEAVAEGESDWPVLNMKLVGKEGTVHYVATIEMSPEPNQAPSTLASDYDLQLGKSPWSVDEIYKKGRLFHGPQFHVLTEMQQLGEGGGVASLNGLKKMDWPNETWTADPAAMDGALQVSLLWGLDLIGAQTLPMRMENFTPFVDEPSEEPLICYVRRKKHNRKQIVADVLITTEGGLPLCELRGVEMFAVPDGV